jgi:hypothetical protein
MMLSKKIIIKSISSNMQKHIDLINENNFYRVAIYIKQNSHKKNILQLICNYDNFYENIQWIYIILSMTELQDWSCLDWTRISKHRDLTIEFILKHQNKPWDWLEISKHPNFNVEWLKALLRLKYINSDELSENHNLTISWLKETSIHWNWRKILNNPRFKYEWFLEILNDGWNLFGLRDFFKEPIENIFSKFTMKKTKKYRNVFFIENPPFGKFISFGKCKFKYLINKRIRYLQSNDYKKCRRPKLTMKNFNEYF